jgi:hypothetical protein
MRNEPEPPFWSEIEKINIPTNDGLDLVAGSVCDLAVCRFLPIHFESYGPGSGAIVGDTWAQWRQKSLMMFMMFGANVKLGYSVYRNGGSPNGPNPGVESPSLGDFGLEPGTSTDPIVGPESPPLPQGPSTFANPATSGRSGYWWELPKGTVLPDGFGIQPDGVDVIPESSNPVGHNTIYPTLDMLKSAFDKAFVNLGWIPWGRSK